MNHLVEIRGKVCKVCLPDQLIDGQTFALKVDDKTWPAVWLRRESLLILRDDLGLECSYRLRDWQVLRDDGKADVEVLLDLRGAATVGMVQLTAMVRPDVPGQGSRAKAAGDGTAIIKSPITGKVLKVMVKVGDLVDGGTPLAIVEAMKMENQLFAPGPGKVQSVSVKAGDAVQTGKELFRLASPGTSKG